MNVFWSVADIAHHNEAGSTPQALTHRMALSWLATTARVAGWRVAEELRLYGPTAYGRQRVDLALSTHTDDKGIPVISHVIEYKTSLTTRREIQHAVLQVSDYVDAINQVQKAVPIEAILCGPKLIADGIDHGSTRGIRMCTFADCVSFLTNGPTQQPAHPEAPTEEELLLSVAGQYGGVAS